LVWYPAEIDVSIRPGWFYHSKEDSRVKSVDKLIDIYYSSVGRNGVLLLNIPPDKRGLFHENDVKALREWKKQRDQTFANNLLSGAAIKSSNGSKTASLVDGKYSTYWTTKGSDTTAVIDFTFKSAREFDVIMLQENITIGQRIEKFKVEYLKGSEWKTATEGTTVGYKRLLRFDPVTSTAIRISIESSRLNPTLSEVGLFKR
jgi:alpha-L-fucosidase